MDRTLTARQEREVDYHRGHAQRNADMARRPVARDVVTGGRRRWWNAYWHSYTILRGLDLRGARVLVPGCGFGEDAVRIAGMGASVQAFDISSEIVDIARRRCESFGYEGVEFSVMAAEDLRFADDSFDLVFCMDILHHVDIPAAIGEFRRVLKPGGRMVGDELYTHSTLERLGRRNFLVDRLIYPRLVRFIYGADRPYITDDERKIDEKEFGTLRDALDRPRMDYFNIFVGRLVPDRSRAVSQMDRLLALALGPLGRFVAGRVVFDGVVRK